MTNAPRKTGSGGSAREIAPKKSLLWKIAKALIVLTLLLVAAHWGLGRCAQVRLDAALEEYRRAGEPIDPADFVEPPVPDAENAAVDLIAADALIDRMSDVWTPFRRLYTLALPLDPKETSIIAGAMQHSRDALRRLETAMRKPKIRWPHEETVAVPALSSQPWREYGLSELLYAAALHAHQTFDDRQALLRVRQLFFLARAIDADPTLDAHITSVVRRSQACEAIFQIAPDLSPLINSDELRPLIVELMDDQSSRAALARAMQGERMIAWQYAQSFADGRTCFMQWREPDFENKFYCYAWKPITLNDAPIAMRHATQIGDAAVASSDWPQFLRRAPSLSGPPEVSQNQWLHPVASALCWWH
jgi:hypothetical protein